MIFDKRFDRLAARLEASVVDALDRNLDYITLLPEFRELRKRNKALQAAYTAAVIKLDPLARNGPNQRYLDVMLADD